MGELSDGKVGHRSGCDVRGKRGTVWIIVNTTYSALYGKYIVLLQLIMLSLSHNTQHGNFLSHDVPVDMQEPPGDQ